MQPSMFQCLFGLSCDNFTMIASDQISTKSVYIMKNDVDKLLPLSDNLVMGISGDQGDDLQFSNFITKNLMLYRVKNGYSLSSEAAVHFTRNSLADNFKDGTPHMLNLLIGGWDPCNGGELWTMDFMAASMKVPFAAHGFAGMFGISILEQYYKRDLTEAEAYEIIQLCVREIHERIFVNLPLFLVKVISKDGIISIPVINPPSRVL